MLEDFCSTDSKQQRSLTPRKIKIRNPVPPITPLEQDLKYFNFWCNIQLEFPVRLVSTVQPAKRSLPRQKTVRDQTFTPKLKIRHWWDLFAGWTVLTKRTGNCNWMLHRKLKYFRSCSRGVIVFYFRCKIQLGHPVHDWRTAQLSRGALHFTWQPFRTSLLLAPLWTEKSLGREETGNTCGMATQQQNIHSGKLYSAMYCFLS